MSAPTETDRLALLRGTLRAKRPRPVVAEGTIRAWQADRRSKDPIAMLSREFDGVAREAVDSAEIAAAMEAAGINDRIARERYQEDSVFRLAELVLGLVPHKAPGPLSYDYDVWRRPFWNHLSRGLLYALPTLPYVVALGFTQITDAGIWWLLATCVVSTAFTQGLAHVAHLFLGYGVPRAAVRVLRVALASSALVGLLAATWAAFATPVGVVVAGIGYGVLLYSIAATVLMVFKREGVLLAALSPAILLSVVLLLAPSYLAQYAGLVCLALLTTVGGVVVVATGVLASEARPVGPQWIPLDAAEWRNAGMHALYGAAAASLMTFAVVDVVQFGSVPNGMSLIGVGMLPLVVSLGFAEADVYGFRSECATAMALCFSHEEFSTAARRVLRRRALAYSTTLVVLTLLVVIPMLVRTGPEPITLLRHVAYGELGVALLGAMLLTSCGLVRPATALLSAGLAVDALVRVPASVSVLTLTMAHTAVFAGLIVAVWWIAFRDLASPLRHR